MNYIGATWNKWNLHIHTPETAKNDNFKGDWDSYLNKIEESDIKVLGITDYYLIENFKKVKEYKDSGRLENIELLIINIEMRLENSTYGDKGVNYHILFSEEVYNSIQEKFLNKLNFEYNDQTYNATKNDFISLGKSFSGNAKLSDKKALEIGIEQFKVNYKEVKRVLNENKSIFEGKYLIGVANSSNDGASGIKDNQMKGIREEILRSCDFIFTSNPGDIKYYSNSHERKLPCIHGCDAHILEKVCNPDLDRNTWIKAELSFDGLKQITHEPISRVKIQKDHPDEKKNYEVIESVTINDESNLFGNQNINFTSGLNTIIGGKSSGKSLLLYKIAQSINQSFIDKISDEKLWNNNYKNSVIEGLETNTIWRNGIKSNIDNQEGNITYIPQMYINELAEREDSPILQEKLINFISENKHINTELEQLNNLEKQISKDNFQQIQIIEEKSRHKIDIEMKKAEIGSLSAITQELKTLQSEIDIRVAESNIDSKNVIKYKDLKENIKNEYEKIKAIEKCEEELISLQSNIKEYFQNFVNSLDSQVYPEKLLSQYDLFKQNLNNDKNTFIKEIEQVKNHEITNKKTIIDTIGELEIEIDPYKKLMEKKDEIEKIEKKKVIEEDKITSIENYENEIEEVLQSKNSAISQLKENTKIYYETLNQVIKSINNNPIKFNDVTIVAEFKENTKTFETFLEKINQRSYLPKDLFISEDEHYKIKYNPSDIEEIISTIILDTDELLNLSESKFKKHENRYLILQSYLQPMLSLHLTMKDNDEVISKMSPGKSGLVILKLLINTLNDNHPILIDQPEDNLDNRTISTDLVDTIREISEQRQVIMVTHNANLVVLTDSENVVVANQDRLKKENFQYDFEYINGPLESNIVEENKGLLKEKGIKTHIFDILEGGERAFSIREKRYEVSYDK
ncbi:hypothetical protein JEOAER750_00807 [Jeotgalicoccus aerolatus]|uniref:ATPase involved in DNA repair n=1 Tax=Jeotgalicoccus aerolatus TaxID=709510 RepID=A0ABS4HPK9_9STAP|nr:hypothetical protein [Jeotgalicoccus aerolatus]MBP1952654.1 hypothetical protein [Jeotgalicoccus aerolatus]GGD91932.1 DNA repair ATPase [Jeotgalicoccus aerolatus]CAD2074066.1 hypothetical protein JEOAER750_00807 [Jeotgalicoccus aerolatus]